MAIAVPRSTLTRSWSEFLYVASGLPLGLAWLITLCVLLAVGVSTVIVTIGVPILAFTLLLWRWGADTERQRAALVLGAPIPRPRRGRPPRRASSTACVAPLRDRSTWRDLGYMLLFGPLGIVAGTIVVALWSAAFAALLDARVRRLGARGLAARRDRPGSAPSLAPVAALPIAALAAIVTRVLASGCARDRGEPARVRPRRADRAHQHAGGVALGRRRVRRRPAAPDRARPARRRAAPARLHRDGARPRPGKLANDPAGADALLAGAHDESKRAMRELRDLVRGIHPSVLSDRGLDAALSGLAERASVPVEIRGGVAERLPPAVETAAYYVVAETLTNVGRHSGATQAYVEVQRDDGWLELTVGDDGRGGARRKPGSGLEGLAQRVEALDGTLDVVSPAGGPTSIFARLPCAS